MTLMRHARRRHPPHRSLLRSPRGSNREEAA